MIECSVADLVSECESERECSGVRGSGTETGGCDCVGCHDFGSLRGNVFLETDSGDYLQWYSSFGILFLSF